MMRIIQSDHIIEHIVEYQDRWYLRRYYSNSNMIYWFTYDKKIELDPERVKQMEIEFNKKEVK